MFLRTVSLFSGCGGMDLGLIEAGFDVIWANDIDKQAVDIYNHNIGSITCCDIREISETEIPDCDVIVAGFPCQPFSSAGKREGVNDERGNLFQDCLRIIRAKRPKVVILENVRGILSIKDRNNKLLVNTIVHALEEGDTGYNVKYQLLDASKYGVPQQRHRVFFVAFRKDLNRTYRFPEPTHSKDHPDLKVGKAIQNTDNLPNCNDIWELSPQSKHLIPYIPEGGSWKNIPYDILPDRFKRIRDNMKKYRAPNFYRRFSREEINGTITAAATPENCGIIHPIENRKYSVREIARIQSFPDDFVFVGESIPAKYRVIGNAVPPLLAKIIGQSIIECLQKETLDIDNMEPIQQTVLNF